ncbi:hypothetical protein L3X38_032421 [Prunus dulcis]|uniref:Uncharacterized protein n=1 Tax=Prunus dulcis TaxID=3755 RepID=A0AAD4YW16_PRUDU|nr:hypothetical protein L3X38_032421 [Prunus dulcis]
MYLVVQLLELREKEKHMAVNRSHSCQLITNGILVQNVVELIKKRNKDELEQNEDELERKRVMVQRRHQLYGGPIRIYKAIKDNLRSLMIAVKLSFVKSTPQPKTLVEIFDTTTNREIVVLDPFPAKENNAFMAAHCDKED